MTLYGKLVFLGGCALFTTSFFGCAQHAQSDPGIERELGRAREHAQAERARVLALETRLARLEYEVATAEHSRTTERARAATSKSTEQRLLERLDVLIALNQSLLAQAREGQPGAQRHAGAKTAESVPQAARLAQQAQQTAPECAVGLTTEQQIRQLLLQLRGERSPWRVDGLSYEESEALRFLLRSERELDHHNPWQ